MRDKKRKSKNVQKASLSMLISKINDKLPAIVFSFSRKQCEEEATFLSKKHFFNYNQEKISKILKIFNESIPEEILNLPSTKKLHDLLPMGIGFHHAGLLPHQRLVVEYLFSHGYLKVLFATETFSVGINMPAKTVILNGFRKYDGLSFRLVKSKEYFQLAGRAGRRGIDTFGYVVSVLNNSERLTDYYDISEFDDEPIISQFSLSYNTILNMIDSYSDDEIDLILKKNFYAFRMMSTHHRQKRMKISFSKKCRILKMMKYITNDGKLTEKGLFAKKIYFNEILISELFATRLYRNLTDIELLQVIAGIIYERRVNDHFSFHGIETKYNVLIGKISANPHFFKKLNKLSLKRMMALVETWADNNTFDMLLPLTNYREGDIVRLFRRIIDMLQQIRRATDDDELTNRLADCQMLIDRDLIAVDY
jgi:superfamily II RNA helicase